MCWKFTARSNRGRGRTWESSAQNLMDLPSLLASSRLSLLVHLATHMSLSPVCKHTQESIRNVLGTLHSWACRSQKIIHMEQRYARGAKPGGHGDHCCGRGEQSIAQMRLTQHELRKP